MSGLVFESLLVSWVGIGGTDHGQFSYKLECLEPDCGHEYGANGTDIFQRKCPRCQDGEEGIEY
jgi:hypothetical protein